MSWDSHTTIETSPVSFSTSGDNTIISGAANNDYWVYIHTLVLIPRADVEVTLKKGSTAISGPIQLKANQPATIESTYPDQSAILKYNPGEDVVVGLSAAVQVDGFVNHSRRY